MFKWDKLESCSIRIKARVRISYSYVQEHTSANVVHSDIEKAFIAPIATPRILNNPGRGAKRFGSVAHNGHGMI